MNYEHKIFYNTGSGDSLDRSGIRQRGWTSKPDQTFQKKIPIVSFFDIFVNFADSRLDC